MIFITQAVTTYPDGAKTVFAESAASEPHGTALLQIELSSGHPFGLEVWPGVPIIVQAGVKA